MDSQEVAALAMIALARRQGVCTPEEILRARGLLRELLAAEQLEKKAGELKSTQEPVFEIDRKTTSSTDFQTVVERTIGAQRTGVLAQVEVEADFDPNAGVNDYTAARWKVTIGNKVRAGSDGNGFQLFQSLSMDFESCVLRAGTVIKVEVRSVDGSEITVDADITGKEIS